MKKYIPLYEDIYKQSTAAEYKPIKNNKEFKKHFLELFEIIKDNFENNKYIILSAENTDNFEDIESKNILIRLCKLISTYKKILFVYIKISDARNSINYDIDDNELLISIEYNFKDKSFKKDLDNLIQKIINIEN